MAWPSSGTSPTWPIADRPSHLTQEALWADLASDDAPRAYRASCALSVEASVPFLSAHLHPAATKGPTNGLEVLRSLRAIAALERVASDLEHARSWESLARGDAAAPATEDAAAALLRLARRKPR